MNELHCAARDGSAKRTIAVLSRGVISIDHRTSTKGFTPLMLAVSFDHPRVVGILLNRGANVAIVNDSGLAALHMSAHEGGLAVTKLLLKAGADLEATTPGFTPLHLATAEGHSEVMRVLIEAGANPNSRAMDGATPLYMAARSGHMDAIKVLLRAKADPLLTIDSSHCGGTLLPLDEAAYNGHLEVARELIQEVGIEGCGGASGGVTALKMAARRQHVEIMGVLTSAGVVDTGKALIAAVLCGQEPSVRFLLQQEWKASGQEVAYLDTRDNYGATPLFCSIQACRSCSPRITRLLVDAGADTATAVQVAYEEDFVLFDGMPLAIADRLLSEKIVDGKDATEEQLHSLEAVRRLLMRVEAVHAASWLWASDVLSVAHAAAEDTGSATKATPTPLVLVLPILRRRAGRPRVLWAALFRHSRKPY